MLKFKTEGQELIYLDNGTVIVGGTVRYLEAQFDFDEDWRGYSEVTAFFKNGAAVYPMDISDGKISAEDNLALEAGTWSVYLKASNYDEDGEKVIKQITSTTVRLNVLCHGKHDGTEFPDEPASIWEQAFNKINVAENGRVEAENKRKTAEEARCVFEEYNPLKEYVKGNKVAFDGSSYVLTADSSKGINPTDSEVWLLIAKKGDNGATIYSFPAINIGVGDKLNVSFNWEVSYDKEDHPGADNWKKGDILISENGKILEIVNIVRVSNDLWYVDFKCFADIKGEPGKDGKDGKDGKKGTTWIFLDFEFSITKGENEEAQFDFSRNILRFGGDEYNNLYMDDYPNVYEWAVGDFFISANRKIIQITSLEWINSEFLNADVVCVSEDYMTVDQVFDWNSENALSGKALAGVLETLSKEVAMANLSNVTNADFKAKAEEAGVGGDAGLAGEKCIMDIKAEVENYTYLPSDAPEGAVYFAEKEYSISNNGYIPVSSGRNEIDTNGTVNPTSIEIVSMSDVALYHEICQLIDKSGSDGAKIRLYMYHEFVGIEANIYFTAKSYSGEFNPGPSMYYYNINGTLDESKTDAYSLDISTTNYTNYELYVYDDSSYVYPAGGYARYNGKWIKL